MELGIGELQAGDNCAFYKLQRDYETRQMKRVNTVIFALVIVVAVCLIGLVIAIAINEWGVTAATGVATIVSGSAMKFILDTRTEHQDRIDKWVKAIEDANCPEG